MAEEVETKPGEKQDTPEVAPEPSYFATPPRWREKLKTHKFKILGGVLGVLVVAGTAFAAYKLGQRQVPPQPNPTPEAVVSPSLDSTADWQTYTNTKYGYLIKHPNNWTVFSEYKEIIKEKNIIWRLAAVKEPKSWDDTHILCEKKQGDDFFHQETSIGYVPFRTSSEETQTLDEIVELLSKIEILD